MISGGWLLEEHLGYPSPIFIPLWQPLASSAHICTVAVVNGPAGNLNKGNREGVLHPLTVYEEMCWNLQALHCLVHLSWSCRCWECLQGGISFAAAPAYRERLACLLCPIPLHHIVNIFSLKMASQALKAHSHSMCIRSTLEFAWVESKSHAHWSRSYYILNFAGLLLSNHFGQFRQNLLHNCLKMTRWLSAKDRACSAYVYLPVACSKRRSKWDYMVRETLHAGMPWVETKEQNKVRL